MGLGDAIAGHMNVMDGAHLKHDLVNDGGGSAFVDVADIDSSLLVLFPAQWLARSQSTKRFG